uniref:Headcase middle domain-containing protein n=1 Tax=Plectus sambesii TaxID=2011161 RepID=A0A914X976_9BILA
MGKTQTARKKETQTGAPSVGCICPEGCVVKEAIDSTKPPSDAVYMSCTNNCATNRYIHAECMEKWEAKLCKIMSTASGRSARWTDTQVRANLWNKKGYECTMHVCRCPCTGFLRREELIDVAALVPQAKLPKLETNPSPSATKNKSLVQSRFVEASAHPKSALRTQRSHSPDDGEWEKPAPRLFDLFDGARNFFSNEGEDEEQAQQYYSRPSPPLPDSALQFPSLPVATACASGRVTSGTTATANAWAVPADALLSTADELISALHALIVKKGGPVAAMDVTLLNLVQNRLSVPMQSDLADCGGLLPWIHRQRSEDLCAIGDKIMTRRIARDSGYLACPSGPSQTSTRSRSTSATSSINAIIAQPPLAPVGSRPRASLGSRPEPVAKSVVAEHVDDYVHDISAHLTINYDFAYDTIYALEGLKLYQIACKTMLK